MFLPEAILINPNTNPSMTARMLAIARGAAQGRIILEGVTAKLGAPLITNEADLTRAAEAVLLLASELPHGSSGIIVSAFGDPGVARLRALTEVPVVGIGEAGIREAAVGGRRFCVATTTPGLVTAINARVEALGLSANYAGVVLTQGGVVEVTNDPSRLEAELTKAIERAVDKLRVEAVVIGGGPLSEAASHLAEACAVEIVQPIPAAVRQLLGAINI